MKKSTSHAVFSHAPFQLHHLQSLIKCPICSSKVQEAHMCPQCCKLFCLSCIKNYLAYSKGQCPSCRTSLKSSNPIYCESLAKQIEQAVEKTIRKMKEEKECSPENKKTLSGTFSTPDIVSQYSGATSNDRQGNYCTEHELRQDYYCKTCSRSVCSDCAVISSNHQGHKIIKISHQLAKLRDEVNKYLNKLMIKRREILQKQKQNRRMLQDIEKQKQIRLSKIQIGLKKLFQYSQYKLTNIVQTKVAELSKTQAKIDDLTGCIEKIERGIKNKNITIIIKEYDFQSKLINRLLKEGQMGSKLREKQFQNPFSPLIGSKSFTLPNYPNLVSTSELIMSDPFIFEGNQWRLRISHTNLSPFNGCAEHISQKSLSIFLQMTKGHLLPSLYKYEILLLNQVDRSKAIGCSFVNQFNQGTYWGLERFSDVRFLQQHNFIHSTQKSIDIVLNVKSFSFYELTKRKQLQIDARHLELRQILNYKKELRKRLGVKALFNQFTCQNISRGVKALVDAKSQKAKEKRRGSF